MRICYSIADYEGKALRPSIIVSRFKSLFPKIVEESDNIAMDYEEENINLISREIPTFNSLVSVLRREDNKVKVSPFWRDRKSVV